MGSALTSNIRLKPEPYTITITTKDGCHNCYHMELIKTIRANSIPYYSRVNSYEVTGGYYDDGMYLYLNDSLYDNTAQKVSGDLMDGSISLSSGDVLKFYQDDHGGTVCCMGRSSITFEYRYSN